MTPNIHVRNVKATVKVIMSDSTKAVREFNLKPVCTYNVHEAKVCQHGIVVRIRDHLLHIIRGQSCPVGVDKICHHDSDLCRPERGIQIR